MSLDIQQENPSPVTTEPPRPPREPLGKRISTIIREVDWRTTTLVSLAMAGGWCLLFLANNWLQVLAGVVPVMAGLYLGRRVKNHYVAHGLILGTSGFLFGLVLIIVYGLIASSGAFPMPEVALEANQPPQRLTFSELLFFYMTFSLFALIPFPAFGTVMGGRAEDRNRQLEKEVQERGGKLERAPVVRTRDDVAGLSLPQLGWYVTNLYRKYEFEFKDYRFIDKDKHLDIEMLYKGETYLFRLSVADKVRLGTVESLVQDMKRRNIPKGVVITSTEFTPDVQKSLEHKKNLVGIDGETLFEIAEKK